MAELSIIAGLGNPGRRYDGTRHNVGFAVLAELARRHGAGKPRTRFEGELAEALVASRRVLLVAPHTFMNASGRCIRQVVHYYRVPLHDLLVVCDDLNLPLGKLRIRRGGSAGGHNGLVSLIEHLGTEEFPRLRLGVGPAEGRDAAEHVLDRFTKQEREIIDEAVGRAADAVAVWLGEGIEAAMNQFN
ncbi:MAG: aminoacyl-tRNA hydrolase [Pirellulales bacterium]